MADITADEIETAVTSVLPVGTEAGKITQEHLHSTSRTHSTKDIASNEMDAVIIEFRDEKDDIEDANNEVTNPYGDDENAIDELESALEAKMTELGYALKHRKVHQHHRLLYEVQAPLTGEVEWLKDN